MKTLFLHEKGNMKFEDYITLCLKNAEFKKYWGEEIKAEENQLAALDESTIWEILNNSTENDLKDIIPNKGIKATVDIGTTIEFYEESQRISCRKRLKINPKDTKAALITKIKKT